MIEALSEYLTAKARWTFDRYYFGEVAEANLERMGDELTSQLNLFLKEHVPLGSPLLRGLNPAIIVTAVDGTLFFIGNADFNTFIERATENKK